MSQNGDLLLEIVKGPDARRTVTCIFDLIVATREPELVRLQLYSSLGSY